MTQTPPEENLTGAGLTTIDGATPHYLVFTIRLDKDKPDLLLEPGTHRPVSWVIPFPTADAASSHKADILLETRNLKGEPEQAWSEVGKLSRCPNRSLLPLYKNIQMEIRPIPQKKEPSIGNQSPISQPANPTPERSSGNPGGKGDETGGAGTNSAKPGYPNRRPPRRTASLPTKGSDGEKTPSKSRAKSDKRSK